MLRPVRNLDVDLTPQAIFALPVSRIVGRKSDIIAGQDDFDSYEGASFLLGGKLAFALRRYRGYPENTATFYLDSAISDVADISAIIGDILRQLDLPPGALQWQRRDDPDL